MAKGRIYEMAFRIGGKLASSFGAATGAASAKLAQLQQQSERLARQQKLIRAWDSVGQRFGTVRSQASGLALQVGGAAAAAAGGIFLLAKATSDVGDLVAKNAQRFGLSTDAYQELAHAAELSGTTIAEVGVGFRAFSRIIDDAKQGSSSAIETFTRLGLDPRQFSSAEQALEAAADQIAKMPDGLAKTNAAMELFGKGGTAMIPLLNAGSKGLREMRQEARDLGLVLSKEAVKQSEEFNDNLHRMKMAALGVRNTFGSALLPVFSELFTKLTGWLTANRGRVQELASQFAAWFRDSAPKLLALVLSLARLAERAYRAADATQRLVGGWDRLAIILAGLRLVPLAVSLVQLGIALWGAGAGAWNFAAAMLANPVTWIVAGILAEIAVIALAITYWDEWTGWLQQASYWIDVVGAALVVMSGGLLLIPVGVLAIIRHGDKLVAMWDAAKAAVTSFASSAMALFGAVASVVGKVWSVVRLVGLALFEAVTFFQRPLWRGIALFASFAAMVQQGVWKVLGAVLGFWAGVTAKIASVLWSLAGTVLGPVVEAWLGYWRLLFSGFAAIFEGLKNLLISGWSLLTETLSGLWSTWGDTVIATVRWVAARAVELLTAPLRLGLQLASMIPAGAAPHLAELVGKMQGGLDATTSAVEGPTTPLAAASAGLASASTSREQARQSSSTLSVSYAPQISVAGNANRADIDAAVRAGNDDLLERLKAAQERERALSYG